MARPKTNNNSSVIRSFSESGVSKIKKAIVPWLYLNLSRASQDSKSNSSMPDIARNYIEMEPLWTHICLTLLHGCTAKSMHCDPKQTTTVVYPVFIWVARPKNKKKATAPCQIILLSRASQNSLVLIWVSCPKPNNNSLIAKSFAESSVPKQTTTVV